MESSAYSLSKRWDTVYRRISQPQMLDQSLADINNALPQLFNVKSCAMIGCGSGYLDLDFVRKYLPNVKKLAAVEPDADGMAGFKTRVAQLLPNVSVDFYQETAQSWKGADQPFDAVLLFHSLYGIPHMERPAVVKKLFDNVVANGGFVFIMISPYSMSENPPDFRRFLYIPGNILSCDGDEVRDIMTSFGFRECYQMYKEYQIDAEEPNDDLMSVLALWSGGKMNVEKVRQKAYEFFGGKKCYQDDVWFAAFKKP